MRTLTIISYDDTISTIRCDKIDDIDLYAVDESEDDDNDATYKIVLYHIQTDIRKIDSLELYKSKEKCTDIYLKLCDYVFHGQAKYGDNYKVTLTNNDVKIDVMKADTSQTSLKES